MSRDITSVEPKGRYSNQSADPVGGSSKAILVQVLGRYSKHPELLQRLMRVAEASESTPGRSRTAPPRVHRITQRLPDAVIRQIVAEYESGLPTTALMRRYEIGKGTILNLLRRAGVHIRAQGMRSADLPRAIELYNSGLSLRRVAEHFDCDAETVRTNLRRAGIPMRRTNARPMSTEPHET